MNLEESTELISFPTHDLVVYRYLSNLNNWFSTNIDNKNKKLHIPLQYTLHKQEQETNLGGS